MNTTFPPLDIPALFNEVADIKEELKTAQEVKSKINRAFAISHVHAHIADLFATTDANNITDSDRMFDIGAWMGRSAEIKENQGQIIMTHWEQATTEATAPMQEQDIISSLESTIDKVETALKAYQP